MKWVTALALQHASTYSRQQLDLTTVLYKDCCLPNQGRRGFTSSSSPTFRPTASVLPPRGWDHPGYVKPPVKQVTASEQRVCTTSPLHKGVKPTGLTSRVTRQQDCYLPDQATSPQQRGFTSSSLSTLLAASVIPPVVWHHPGYVQPSMEWVMASELQHASTSSRQQLDLTPMLYKDCCLPNQAMNPWQREFTSSSSPTLPPTASVLPPRGWDHPGYVKPPMKQIMASELQRMCTMSPLQKGVKPTGLASRITRQQNCCKGPNQALTLSKRCFSASSSSARVIVPPPPPQGWDHPERPLMQRAVPPGYLEPDFAKTLKTVPGIVPQVCVDEAAFLINYEPLEYIKAFPLVREKKILGSKNPNNDTDCPSFLLPADSTLELMRSLAMLARFFHVNGCCLPRLEMSNLVITGAGRFRLKEFSGFRELNEDNMRDVYANIGELFVNLLSSYGDASNLPGYHMLRDRLEDMGDWRTGEYPIYFNSFFLPLANKSTALLRLIDIILRMSKQGRNLDDELIDLPHQRMLPNGITEWRHIAENNDYLKQWLEYRTYGHSRIEFLRFLRAVLCHKLDYGLPPRFVDFLVYALYPKVLSTLERNMWKKKKLLKQARMEELFPHNILIDFPDLPNMSVLSMMHMDMCKRLTANTE